MDQARGSLATDLFAAVPCFSCIGSVHLTVTFGATGLANMFASLDIICPVAAGAEYAMTAGNNAGDIGYDQTPAYGSILPSPALYDASGLTSEAEVSALWVQGIGAQLNFELSSVNNSDAIPDSDLVWREIEVEGVFDTGQQTLSLLRADASNTTTGTGSRNWQFPGQPNVFVIGNTYNVLVSV